MPNAVEHSFFVCTILRGCRRCMHARRCGDPPTRTSTGASSLTCSSSPPVLVSTLKLLTMMKTLSCSTPPSFARGGSE